MHSSKNHQSNPRVLPVSDLAGFLRSVLIFVISQGDDETEEDDLEEESNLESIKNSDNMVFIVEDGRDYEDDQK